MTDLISLNGPWRVIGTDPAGGSSIEVDGAVPGHVHPDLQRAGRIPDPFWRDGADECQWVERWNWRYERTFTLDESFDRTWAEIEFAGLDTYASITLNGTEVGRTSNMLVPHRFEVGQMLRAGENTIAVDFSNIWSMIEGKRLDYPCAFDTPERLHVRRMQCTFHWDWVNRFVSYGIWRSVTIRSYDRACVRDVFVYTKSIASDAADLSLTLETERRTDGPITAEVQVLDPCGAIVWSKDLTVESGSESMEVQTPNPRLWWPAGYGDQPLYRCQVTLRASDGSVVDTRETTFGIRTVEIEEIVDAPGSPEMERTLALRAKFPNDDRNGDAPGSSFTALVNGERIFCRGGNWVPADPWPSRVTPEWYDNLVRLVRDGNMNCLRTWGGGIYEQKAFWDACDRYGILVCQDFIMACARYPEDDPEFMDAIRLEAPKAIRMLRNHPSLAWWNGDNENGMNGDADDPAYWGRKVAEEITGPACAELDPSRLFLPTSPYRGKPNNCMTTGDCHFSSLPWDRDVLAGDLHEYKQRISDHVGRFMSESTSAGTPSMRSLLKFLTPEDLADPTQRLLYFHTKDNPYLETRLYDVQTILATKLFGQTDDLQTRIRRQGHLQHEWIRLVMEATRRSKWYCGGILFWMYNDCWPATGWSLVDYYGIPKAGWYAMKRGSQPLIASIDDAGDAYRIWICNDTLAPVEGSCALRVQPWSVDPRWQRELPISVPANSSVVVGTIAKSEIHGLGLDSILVCDLTANACADRAWHFAGMPSEMTPPPATLTVRREHTPGGGRITISTDTYARVVTLDADLAFSDNYFDLLPGEARVVEYALPSDTVEPPSAEVSCWNERTK